MRMELKVFRIKQKLTQQEMAAKTGVSVPQYNLIENGNRRGSQAFWLNLQKEFNLDGGTVWKMQNEQN